VSGRFCFSLATDETQIFEKELSREGREDCEGILLRVPLRPSRDLNFFIFVQSVFHLWLK
jgi:hypothetical protein